jgi:hypothetical protein
MTRTGSVGSALEARPSPGSAKLAEAVWTSVAVGEIKGGFGFFFTPPTAFVLEESLSPIFLSSFWFVDEGRVSVETPLLATTGSTGAGLFSCTLSSIAVFPSVGR